MSDNIGHNFPGMVVVADETARAISDWMQFHPVIETEQDAREAKVLIDRGDLCYADLDKERTDKVKPLNEQVETINQSYRKPKGVLHAVVAEIRSRYSAFLLREEARRQAEADEAAIAAYEAEEEAREAERKEKEGFENASVGEIGVNVIELTKAADEKFQQLRKAERDLARKQRAAENVRIGGGFRRAIGLRNKEELVVQDWNAALIEMGMSKDISAAICKAARAYRRLHGKLPAGVESKIERKA